jgi:peptide/nickel transport system substrate-binding protein
MSRAVTRLAVTVVVALSLASVPQQSGAQTDRARTLNVALFGEPDFIDPHLSTSVGFVPIDNAYEALVSTDRDKPVIVPQLAESYTVSPDGRTFTFRIRRGVKFHDGGVLDAEAVRASFERIRRLNKGPVWALSHLESLEVTGPYTVVMKIRPGGPPFLEALSLIRIVSPKTIKERDSGGDLAQDFLNRISAGTGPYRILSWQRGERLLLRAFEDYWGGWPHPSRFDTVNMLVVPEAATQRMMLEKGEIDIAMKFLPEAIPRLEKNPDLQVIRAPGLRVLYLRLNNAAPPTNDVRVRRAINYAFDFASYQKAMENTYEPPVGPVPPLFLGNWKPNYPYKYDVAKAKELLAAAGYTEARKARLLADILIATPDQRKAAEILQAGLRATGLADVEIQENEWPVMLRYHTEWQKSKDPATARHLFGLFTPPRVPDAYAYLWYTYHSKAIGPFARNVMNYSNPKVDDLIDRATTTIDPRQKITLYRQAAQIIVDDAADLFIGVQSRVYLMRKNVKGFLVHPLWYPTVMLYHMSRE